MLPVLSYRGWVQLDVESLRVFAAVLDEGGMTAAADSLGMSQSAVSWRIKRLEERVGRDLLVRDGRRLSPSRDGRELLVYARSILDTHDEAVARLESTVLEGSVRLGSTEEASARCTRDVGGRFFRIHPNVNLDFHVDNSRRLAAMISNNELDVAIIQLELHEVRARDTVLWYDDLLWVSSPEWTYTEGEVPLITFGDDGFYRPIAQAALKDAGIAHRIVFSGPSLASVLAAIDAGVGVALMSRRSLGDVGIPWPRAGEVEVPAGVVNVARVARGATSEVAAELLRNIRAELAEVPADEPPRA